MRKRKTSGFFQNSAVIFGVILVGFALWLSGAFNNIHSTDENALPQINITLNNITLDEMKDGAKETRYPGNFLSIDDNGVKIEYSDVEIKGRGNATWTRPKRPWQIEFKNSNVELFGRKNIKKWILLADYSDLSHLRNFATFEFARRLGMEYVCNGKMVEVSFNGEYEGLFYMVPKIESVVELNNELGVIVEGDNLRQDAEFYKSATGNLYYLKDAVAKKEPALLEQAMTNFMTFLNEAELSARKKDYDKTSELLDYTSFSQYFLVNEFALDPDAYWIGFHLYKDGAEDKIHAGPVWDFDMAYGTRYWGDEIDQEYFSPSSSLAKRGINDNELIYDLLKIPEFEAEVKRIFQEKLSGRGEEFLAALRAESDKMKDALKRDAEKWGYTDEYEDEIDYVLDWIQKRYQYFEEVYGDA